MSSKFVTDTHVVPVTQLGERRLSRAAARDGGEARPRQRGVAQTLKTELKHQ